LAPVGLPNKNVAFWHIGHQPLKNILSRGEPDMQGDQIGRTCSPRAIVFFGQFFNYIRILNVGANFFHQQKLCTVFFILKNWLAEIVAIFSQTHLVTLLDNKSCSPLFFSWKKIFNA
jgi:hypothetical protein